MYWAIWNNLSILYVYLWWLQTNQIKCALEKDNIIAFLDTIGWRSAQISYSST